MKASESLDLDTNECEIAKRRCRFQVASFRNIARQSLLVACARPGSFDELLRRRGKCEQQDCQMPYRPK